MYWFANVMFRRMQIGAVRLGIVALLVSGCASCVGLPFHQLPVAPDEQEGFERVAQDLIAPLIRGIAYDVQHRRVFISACPDQEYACDLLIVDLNGPGGADEQDAVFFLHSDQYGYTWPAVSPDGLRLAVVRTSRRQRPSQRVVRQELIEVDLQSGVETVLADSGENGRIDRVVFVGPTAILMVRSFRSDPSVRCLGDYCTDVAQFIIIRGDEPEALPIEMRADGALGRGRIEIVSLGDDAPIWLSSIPPLQDGERLGETVSPQMHLLDVQTGGLQTVVPNIVFMYAALDRVDQEYGSLGGWRRDDIVRGNGGPTEFLPFRDTRASHAGHQQTTLSSSMHAALVAKTFTRAGVSLHVVTLENQGDGSWVQTDTTVMRYQPPPP